MAFFDKLRRGAAAARLWEESLYELVMAELKDGARRDGIWAKALVDAEGNEAKAESLYIKYRVQALKDEMTLSAAMHDNSESDGDGASAFDATPRESLSESERVENCRSILKSKGISLSKRNDGGWVVCPRIGGSMSIGSIDDLESFVRSVMKSKK